MIDVSQSGFYIGDCRELLRQLPDACAQTCITSPCPSHGEWRPSRGEELPLPAIPRSKAA